MKTNESHSSTDYRYYPVEYPTKEFSTVGTSVDMDVNSPWVTPVDKTKFRVGVANNYLGNNCLAIMTVGF